MKKIYIILLVLIILLSSQIVCSRLNSENLKAKRGVIDLSKYKISKIDGCKLFGEWGTYLQKLYSPQEVNNHNPDLFSELGMWEKYNIFNKKVSFIEEMNFGYATYHLLLKNKPHKIEAIKIGQIANSYKVWINGKLLVENGQVGKSQNLEISKFKERIVKFPQANKVDIVIQISNFHFKKKQFAAPMKYIELGSEAELIKFDYEKYIFSFLTLVMSIVLFFAYLFRGKSKEILCFSLFNLLISLRIIIFDNLFNLDFINSISGWYLEKINILITILIVILFFTYLKLLYKKMIFDIIYMTFLSISCLLAIFTIVSSVKMYNQIFILTLVLLATLIIYLFYIAILSLFKRQYNCFLNMLGFIIIIIVYKINLFFNNLFSKVLYILMILLILYQVVYLIKEYFRSTLEFNQEKEKKIETKQLLKMVSVLHSTLNSKQIARLTMRKLNKLISYNSIVVMKKKKDYLEELAIRGERNIKAKKIKISENQLFNDLINRKKPMIINNVKDVSWFKKHGKLRSIKSWLGMPLIIHDKVVGVLIIGRKNIKKYSERNQNMIINFSQELAIALKNSYKYEKLKELAAKDSLTNLYNKKVFKELAVKEYQQAVRYDHDLSLVLLEIDQYQNIINEFGDAAADEIIKIIAQRCKESIRVADYIGRYHGIKLGIILIDTNLIGAKELAIRLQEVINKVVKVKNYGDILVSASYGIASLQDQKEFNILFESANNALTRAQKKGGDCIKTIEN